MKKLVIEAGRAMSLNIVAEIYFEKGDYESAMNFYMEVEKEYSALNEKKGFNFGLERHG
jgi:hypothetical protein